MTTKLWFSAAALAAQGLPGFPKTKQGVMKLARREGWLGRPAWVRERQGRGGGFEFFYQLVLLHYAAEVNEARRALGEAKSAQAAATARLQGCAHD